MSRMLSAALVAAAASISGMVAEGPLQGTQAEPAATATAALAAAPTTASFSQAGADSSSSTKMRRELLVNGGITNVGCTDDDTYKDVWSCAEWAGYPCQNQHFTAERSAELVRSCPVSCNDVTPVCNPPPVPPGVAQSPYPPPPPPLLPGMGVPNLEGSWFAPFTSSPGDG